MKPNTLDLADDTQSVVIQRPGSDLERPIEKALLRPFRSQKRSQLGISLLPMQGAHWYLPHSCNEILPKVGDTITTKEGQKWTICEVHFSSMNQNWQCVSFRYHVDFGLDEFVDHLRVGFTKTSAGTLIKGFRAVKTGLPAKFSDAVQKFDKNAQESLYVVTPEKISVEPQDALRRHDGSLYEITAIKQPFTTSQWTEMELKRVL